MNLFKPFFTYLVDRFCEMLEHNLRTVASEQEQHVSRRLELMSSTTPRNGRTNEQLKTN